MDLIFGHFLVCLFSSKGQINATRITAIAATQEDSDVVEIRSRINPTQIYQFKCDVLVNGKIKYFNYTWEKIQIFKSTGGDLLIYFSGLKKILVCQDVFIVSPLSDEYQSNFTIMFNTSGIGVNVECMDGLIHVRASVPPALFVN